MILNVERINKSYGKENILQNITFQIEEPTIMAIVGPNGSGKTTLLNIITNLIEADDGEIRILNKSHKDPNIFREISYMQDYSVLYNYLTGYDHLQFIGDIQGISKQQILSTAQSIGIKSYLNKKVGKYSLGMNQHLLLTMAILNRPKLLILDEPFNGLDPTSAIRLRNLLLELHDKGTTILLSSHNLSEIDRITTHILFLKDGRFIQDDLSQYENDCYILKTDQLEQAQEVLKQMGVTFHHIEDHQIYFFHHHIPIQTILFELLNQQITIIDFDKKIMGSEYRYQEIFGQKDVRDNETG
ncbi:ABC-2 type transport system ATP-binding protein [Melghiribacillus thermohalophilus]|uniref:ABC-2 type transport system ATP-binding protein n=1 Tax=Melghiribacillus thermohalophilus TaxID=1324956 RepID=A0A4R3N3R9_9BACI|nr:ABC transporter ATP-binding protein [Melghiribacillus thermohalophilus]TCT23595.1 ABC-2 type transport system ATP-binding protein [Melghiribacillus thermohalophilus]